MKLSIIIPAYNAAKYVERCVNSIISQNYSDAEIILVDDGSTDNTLNICRALSDKHLNIKALHKNNGGVSSARNFGIDNASGEYLMFVDVDDYLLPDTLKDAMKVAEENPEAELCVFGFDRISRRGIISQSKLSPHKYSKNEILEYIKGTDALTLGTPCAKLYKSEFIKSNNFRFDITRKLFEDICFNLHILKACSNVVTSDIKIYCYEVNNQSATAKFDGEKFIDDAQNYMNSTKVIISQIETENNNNRTLSSEIIFATQKTICHNSLYQIYNLYKQKSSKQLKKYRWMKRLTDFMKEITPDWQQMFPSSFPHLFVSAYKIHPQCANIMMRFIFLFKH